MKAAPHILFLAVLCITGCKEEDPLPIEEPENKEKEITEASIGASGGVLKTESIQVTIPDGAFSSTENIQLTELTEASVFGDNSRSVRYKIEGLPETFNSPLKISIAYQGTLTGETYLLVGEEAMNPENGEGEDIYDFLPAIDSSGYLIAYFQGIDQEQTAGELKKAPSATGKKWVSVEVASDFFSYPVEMYGDTCRVYIPADNKDAYSPMIIDYLDNAQEIMYRDIFPGLGALNMNIKSVFFSNLSSEDYCRFAWRNGSSDGRKNPRGILAVNVNKVEDEVMRVMVGREVLRSFLFCFDPLYPHMRSPEQIPHHWFDQAVIAWSETEFAHELDRPGYIPTDFRGNEMKPLQGMHAGILQGEGSLIQNTLNHGRGMSSFIEYLVDKNSHAIIYGIYSKIFEKIHPVEAIQWILETYCSDAAGYKFIDDWYFYLCEYLRGIHFNVSGSTFAAGIPASQTFSINGDTDTLKVFPETYPDLSARLFKIDLNDQEFRQQGALTFSFNEVNMDMAHVGFQVFGYGNEKLIEMGGKIAYQASDFQVYNSLVVMVYNCPATNPYTGSSNIEFQVRAKKSKALTFTHCKLEITTKGIYEYNLIPPVNPDPSTSTLLFSNIWKTIGKCTGNVFSGNLDPENSLVQDSGTITVIFDDSLNISSYEVITNYETEADTIKWNIRGSKLKKSYESVGTLQHEVTGAEVCNAVSSIYFYSGTPGPQTGTRRYNKMTELDCDENSRMKFTFSNW